MKDGVHVMTLPDFLESNIDGEICLRGHRIRLIDIAARYDEGHSAEAIAIDDYPTLSLPLIHKTIAFFLENEAEVRSLLRENEDAMQRLAAATQSTPNLAELRRRMANRRQAEAS
jgi:uncharacterized protein (DUF433 family)